jgi:hypothetical protein
MVHELPTLENPNKLCTILGGVQHLWRRCGWLWLAKASAKVGGEIPPMEACIVAFAAWSWTLP